MRKSEAEGEIAPFFLTRISKEKKENGNSWRMNKNNNKTRRKMKFDSFGFDFKLRNKDDEMFERMW